jgi:hypothetical protein
MKKMVKYLLSAVFLLSALAKAVTFHGTLDFLSVLYLPISWLRYFLIVLIASEIAIAYLVAADFLKVREVFLGMSIFLILLVIVNVVLALDGIEDCGCFGTTISIPPSLSIVKNFILLSLIYFLRRESYE